MEAIFGSTNKKKEETALIVDFEEQRTIRIIPQTKTIIPSLKVLEIIDNIVKQTVVAKTTQGVITLWGEKDYASIGDWTNEDVKQRIKALFPNLEEKKEEPISYQSEG